MICPKCHYTHTTKQCLPLYLLPRKVEYTYPRTYSVNDPAFTYKDTEKLRERGFERINDPRKQ